MPIQFIKETPIINQRLVSRFMSHVLIEDTFSCWTWLGCKNEQGYGRMLCRVNGKSINYFTHRISYMIYKGKIPKSKLVLHRCDTPSCVNPTHLFIGTPRDNMVDSVNKGRHGRRPTESYDRGEDHARARLTNRLVKKILCMHKRGIQGKDIADTIGVSWTCVYDVLLGRTWFHLTGITYTPRREYSRR